MGGGRVIEIKDAAQWQKIIGESQSSFGGKGVVVDFSATWCGPCQMIGPVFAKLSEEYTNVTFVKVDVDDVQEVAQACKVSAMPTFQSYFNGQLVDTLVGADPRKLMDLIKDVAARGPSGAGQKLGGGEAGVSTAGAGGGGGGAPEDMRARMLAAAEARAKAAAGSS